MNAVCPGWVETDMVQYAIDNITARTQRTQAEAREAIERMNPQNRIIYPDEVARIVLLLAEDGSAGMTGQAINVDGGAVMA